MEFKIPSFLLMKFGFKISGLAEDFSAELDT